MSESSSDSVPSLRATTRSHAAYEELKRRILTLRLAPGEAFTEAELAAELGLSKATVRDALHRLRHEGFVESHGRTGSRVTPVTVKDARDLFALRVLLEAEAASLAARRGGAAEELRALDELSHARYLPTEPDSIASFLSANSAFHLMIATVSGNARLHEALAMCIERSERLFHLGLSLTPSDEDQVHEHHDLVEAIVSGDADAARAVATQHTQASCRNVLDALLSSDAVLMTNLGSGLTVAR
jgi:DNA-binding GntR family transcriptional regulator